MSRLFAAIVALGVGVQTACITVQQCDQPPCAVSYSALRPGHEPPGPRRLLRAEFLALPSDKIAVLVFSREEQYPVVRAQELGFEIKGKLTISADNKSVCADDNFMLMRWKAAALGFDGILIHDRGNFCSVTALTKKVRD